MVMREENTKCETCMTWTIHIIHASPFSTLGRLQQVKRINGNGGSKEGRVMTAVGKREIEEDEEKL